MAKETFSAGLRPVVQCVRMGKTPLPLSLLLRLDWVCNACSDRSRGGLTANGAILQGKTLTTIPPSSPVQYLCGSLHIQKHARAEAPGASQTAGVVMPEGYSWFLHRIL